MPEIIEFAIEGAFRRQQNASVADHIVVGKVGDRQVRGVVENRLLYTRIPKTRIFAHHMAHWTTIASDTHGYRS